MTDKLLQRKGALETEKQNLVRLFAQGRISQDEFDTAMVGVGTDLGHVDAEIPTPGIAEEELSDLLGFAEWLLDKVGVFGTAQPRRINNVFRRHFSRMD